MYIFFLCGNLLESAVVFFSINGSLRHSDGRSRKAACNSRERAICTPYMDNPNLTTSAQRERGRERDSYFNSRTRRGCHATDKATTAKSENASRGQTQNIVVGFSVQSCMILIRRRKKRRRRTKEEKISINLFLIDTIDG